MARDIKIGLQELYKLIFWRGMLPLGSSLLGPQKHVALRCLEPHPGVRVQGVTGIA